MDFEAQMAKRARAIRDELEKKQPDLLLQFSSLMDEMFPMLMTEEEKELIEVAAKYENTDHDQSKLEGQILHAAYKLHGARRIKALFNFIGKSGHNVG